MKYLINLTCVKFNSRAGRYGWLHDDGIRRCCWQKPRTIHTGLFGANVVTLEPRRSLHCYLTKREAGHVVNFKRKAG